MVIISQSTHRLVTCFSKKKKGSSLPLQKVAKDGLGVSGGDAKEIDSSSFLQVEGKIMPLLSGLTYQQAKETLEGCLFRLKFISVVEEVP